MKLRVWLGFKDTHSLAELAVPPQNVSLMMQQNSDATQMPAQDWCSDAVRENAVKHDTAGRVITEERETFLASLLASSCDALIGRTVDGTIEIWNAAAEALFEYRADEVIGKPLSILLPPEVREGKTSTPDIIEIGTSRRFETVLATKSGQLIDVSFGSFPVKNDRGEVLGSAAIVHDISARRRAEETLRLSEAKYRSTFEVSRNAAVIADARTGMLVDANPAALALLGRSIDEIPGLHQADVHASEDIPAGRSSFGKYRYESGATEHVVLRGDGARVPVEIAASPMQGLCGRELILGIFYDITERRRIDQELRDSEERFRIMADGCPSSVWVTDAECGLRYINQRFGTFSGATFEELEGLKWLSLIHPEDAQRYLATLLRAVKERTSFNIEARAKRSDGQWRWITSNAAPRLSLSGEFLGHVGISTDITEHREAAELVRSSEEKFRQLAENIDEIFWILDAAGSEFLYVSPQFERIFGRTCESVYQNALEWPEAIEPDDRVQAQAIFEKQQTGEQAEAEYRIKTPSGEVKWIRNLAFPIRDQTGRLVRMVGLAEDISERKRANLDLWKAKEAAEAASRAKSAFLANMSHELRTPLNGVLGMTEFALDTELTGEQRELLENVKSSAGELLAIIIDILDFSNLQAGTLELDATPFRLHDHLARIIKPFSLQAAEKGLKLRWTVRPDVPDQITTDPARLFRIIAHLLGNALKFTSEGEVELCVALDGTRNEHAQLHFFVRDSGTGIPLENQKSIFEAFSQVNSTFNRKFGGTGLGLAISAKLAEMIGGRIWVESQPGAGSCFHFTIETPFAQPEGTAKRDRTPKSDRLPAIVVDQSAATQGNPARVVNQEGSTPVAAVLDFSKDHSTPANFPKLRILLAEDNPVNEKVARRMLEKQHHAVTVARTGCEVLRVLDQHTFDLILMDIQMPEMDGLEATAAIREREQGGEGDAHIPIIALTAHALPGDRECCLAGGMDGYATKPINLADLTREIDRVRTAGVLQSCRQRPVPIVSE